MFANFVEQLAGRDPANAFIVGMFTAIFCIGEVWFSIKLVNALFDGIKWLIKGLIRKLKTK